MATIVGEENPGFNLWTSAHGFHHLELTKSSLWRIFWMVILAVSCISLICLIIYYFYYVFAFAVYSRILLQNSATMPWPTTIICDRQMFSYSKVLQVPLLSQSHASLLSWFVHPSLAKPEIMNSTRDQYCTTDFAFYSIDPRINQLANDINNILTRPSFTQSSYSTTGGVPGGAKEQLLRAIAPNCTQLILQCTLGKLVLSGWDCCIRVFDQNPYFTTAGTCFSTRGASLRHQVKHAGDASSFTVTTMHDIGSPFDPLFTSADLYGSTGLNFAVVDDEVTPMAAMAERAMTVLPGQYASVGLSRTVIDNYELGWSAIGRTKCVKPGERNPRYVDADLNYGVSYQYGYTIDSCNQISKMEMLARELLYCTYSPLSGDSMDRCSGNQSASFYRSFIDSNNSPTPDIQVYSVDNKPGLRTRFEKQCALDCVQDRYTLSPSYSPFTTTQSQTLQAQVLSSGQPIQGTNPSLIILKLYMRSLEFQRITNFPQNGVQFVAELGGLMTFFLGISIISIVECLCFCFCCGWKKQNGDDVNKLKGWGDN